MKDDLRNSLDLECPRCRGAYLEQAPEHIWGHEDWVIEPKKDGERLTMQIGAESSILVGRNRQDFLKGVARAGKFRVQNETNRELAAIACRNHSGTMLDGEVTDTRCLDGTPDKDTLRRKEAGDFIGYVVWGVLTWKGKDVRHLSDDQRRKMAGQVLHDLRAMHKELRKQGKPGFPIIARIRLIERKPATMENLEKMLSPSVEGVVAKDKTKPLPQNKHGVYQRTNTWWWKIKGDRRRTIDAFVVGVTQAMSGGSGVRDIKRQPNGKAATFTVAMKKGGQPIEVGKVFSLPELDQERGVQYFQEEYWGRVIEFQVSGWDGQAFRWPKFLRWREDKTPDDCIFKEQIG